MNVIVTVGERVLVGLNWEGGVEVPVTVVVDVRVAVEVTVGVEVEVTVRL